MKKQFSTYVTKYFDDLLQEGYMAVLEGLETYDVKRAKPTTFFPFLYCAQYDRIYYKICK